MSNFGMVLAQAGDTGNGEAFLGWIIIVALLWGVWSACKSICSALTRKKRYGISGSIREL